MAGLIAAVLTAETQ